MMEQAERLGIGFEMIMEAWGFEYLFNSRGVFVPEWEELWMRYLIARYDAYNAVYFWTPMNEYEFYPNGDWHYKPVADRWALRIARWIKGTAQHGHVVSIHNGPQEPPFAKRFAADLQAIDTILFQSWGTIGEQDGWLAAGIEDKVASSLKDWPGTAILAEYGYERNPDFENRLPYHSFMDPEHTRRGAWRGAFCALPVIHGFENSWGPWQVLDRDQPGMVYLLHMRHFFTQVVPFADLRPAPELVEALDGSGTTPLALAAPDGWTGVFYLPVGGEIRPNLPDLANYRAEWFDPRTANLSPAELSALGCFSSPYPVDEKGHPADAVLILRKSA